MKTSPTGVAIIQAFESCLKPIGGGKYRTYRCPANVLTIGWGTTCGDYPALQEGDVWDKAKCDEVFAASLTKYEAAVDKAAASRPSPLTQAQYDALVSFVYNVGPGGLTGSVGAAVRSGRDKDVPAALARWCRGGGQVLPGLVRRRKAEGLLYAGDLAGASDAAQAALPGAMPQSVQERVASKAPHPAATGAVAVAAATASGHAVLGFDLATVFGVALVLGLVVFAITHAMRGQ